MAFLRSGRRSARAFRPGHSPRRREQVFLISKVLPSDATAAGTVAACDRSRQRLRTDQIDLYLLDGRGAVRLAETLEGFEALIRAGKIRYWA